MPAGAKNVASVGGLPIEEISATLGVTAENDTEMFHEYGNDTGGRGHRGRHATPVAYKYPEQPSQSFTNLVEHFSDSSIRREGPLVVGSAAVAAILGRAIDAYEKTAVVINTAHVASGALVLATAVVLALRAHRPAFREALEPDADARRSRQPMIGRGSSVEART